MPNLEISREGARIERSRPRDLDSCVLRGRHPARRLRDPAKDDAIVPLTREETATFWPGPFPQVFGITIYPTERGPDFRGANRPRTGQPPRFLSTCKPRP